MRRVFAVPIIVVDSVVAHAAELPPKHVQLLCHRTADEDIPENPLESLEQAALLGCDVVEIDLRRTSPKTVITYATEIAMK
jgi:glycerophosphoryl diester phosphodiesterase